MGRFYIPPFAPVPFFYDPTAHSPIHGIPDEIAHAYYDYLWRLGEHSFGTEFAPGETRPGRLMDTERFVVFHFFKLWPKWGRRWHLVGAASNPFPEMDVMDRDPSFPLYPETEHRPANEFILRYNERLWNGRLISIGRDGRWYILMYHEIGAVLMFERRGHTKAKRYQDEWDFGMSFWEERDFEGKKHLYLWGGAEVTYVGMATKVQSQIYSVRNLKA